MKYVKSTVEYLFIRGKGKRFLFLFLFCLIPGAMLSYGIPAENFIENLVSPPQYHSWGSLWLSYFRSGFGMISLALGTIASFLAAACIADAAIKHFRIGVFSLKQFGKSFNDYFLPAVLYTLFNCVLCAVCYTLFSLISYSVYLYWSVITYTIWSFVVLFFFSFIALYITSAMSLWFPSMCITGIFTPSSMLDAFYKSRSKQKYFFPGHALCFLVLSLTAVLSYVTRSIWYVSFIIGTVGYAASYAFSIIYNTVIYFGENCLPREDLTGRYR